MFYQRLLLFSIAPSIIFKMDFTHFQECRKSPATSQLGLKVGSVLGLMYVCVTQTAMDTSGCFFFLAGHGMGFNPD